MPRMTRLTGPAALFLLATTAGCSGPREPQTKAPAAAQPSTQAQPAGQTTIDVAMVVERPLDVTLSLPAELQPYQDVAIHPRVAGFVKAVAVDRGSVVKRGDLLLTLDAPELTAQRAEAESKVQAAQAQVSAAQAKADADRATFDRLKAASATAGVVAGNELLLAQKASEASAHQLSSAQQGVEAARHALASVRDMEAYLQLTAPFAGVVSERNVHPGALVGSGGGASGTPLLRLVENRRLRLVVPVPEAYTTDIAEGTDLTFTVAAYPGVRFTGRVARLADVVDAATRTMAVELDVANADGRLAPGTFCQVAWPVRRSTPSLFVPSGSVASTTDRTFVIRVRDGRTEWVDVKSGLTSGALVEVFGDLHAGDTVAARGTDELRAGTAVRATAK